MYDSKQADEAKTAMNLAGVRAATMLSHLLDCGQIPAHHVSHAREIVEEHESSTKEWHKAIGIAEVTRG